MKLRLVLPGLLAAVAVLFVVGCGGGNDEGSGGSDPATVAPVGTLVYLDFTLQPQGETKANIEALAKTIAGIDDLGGLIGEELEESAAEDGEEIDFQKEVVPWLGETGAYIYPLSREGGDFDSFALVAQTTDSGAAESFIEKQAKASKEEIESGSFEGVDFKVDEDGEVVGVIDDLLVVAKDEGIFEEVVTASKGESLADESAYSEAVELVPGRSAANVYVNIGDLLRLGESEGEVDQDTKAFFENAGLEFEDATAVASLVPGSDQIEIDVSTNVAKDDVPSGGDGAQLLGSLPAHSIVALAAPEFGESLRAGLDQVDEEGIPSEGVPPGELKKTMKRAGIDLEAIAGSIGGAGAYVTGNSQSTLGGALILEAEDPNQAKNTVSNLGLFLRNADAPGVTAINGEASGFSIRSPELGRQPIVVAAKGDRIAIGYGLASALATFEESGETLSDSAAYREALTALGDTPVAAFLDGPAALKLASSLVPPGEEGFEEAKPYLRKIDYVAIGSDASGDLVTAKLIVGVGG